MTVGSIRLGRAVGGVRRKRAVPHWCDDHLRCHCDGAGGLSGQRHLPAARHQPHGDFGSLQEAEAFAEMMREIDAKSLPALE